MDLYGLIWFIDATLLPGEREFLARYLRRPENYPELSKLVSPFCFRTLRAQASRYAKVTRRVLREYAPSPEEQALYELLYAYVNQPVRLAFPEMDQYELALRLLGLQGSSTNAVLQTIRVVVRRLESMPNAREELLQWRGIQAAAERVKQDAKTLALLSALKQGFAVTLAEYETENRRAVVAAEDVLFTTFTKKLADKVTISPQYIQERSRELKDALWDIAKSFFLRYNEENGNPFVIDEQRRTITAAGEERPTLFYYWTGSRNKPYKSLGSYGMGTDFKPKNGQITLTSVIERGVLHETACAATGTLTVNAGVEPCEIGLYTVTLASKSMCRDVAILCGRTDAGRTLTERECRDLLALPIRDWTEDGKRDPHWLKLRGMPHRLDALVPTKELAARESEKRTPAQTEEIEKLRLHTKAQKAALPRALAELERQLQAAREELESVTGDRLKRLALQKKATALNRELRKGQEGQFFEEMWLDLELEEKIKAFTEREKVTATVTREFILKIQGAFDGNA